MSSESFDPYHKWFGIPAHEQPPNHYRLLRIALFEADAEVIDNAYEKEMGHLKHQEHGPHVELVEPLSRELIAARNCLLDTKKKAAYDAELRERPKEGDEKLAADLAQRKAIDEQNRLRTIAEQTSARQGQASQEVNRLRSESEQLATEDHSTPGRPNVQLLSSQHASTQFATGQVLASSMKTSSP